jgi:hypothetical protein
MADVVLAGTLDAGVVVARCPPLEFRDQTDEILNAT